MGGSKDVSLDTRVIAASNRDLKSECQEGKFRLDLYYRLSVIQIDVPALRERGDDGLILANHFISQFKQQLRKKTRGLSSEVEDIFRKYSWPGNVRELRNVIERVMILEDGDLITTKYLPRDLILPEYHRPIVTAPLAGPPAQQVTSAPPPVESKPPSGSQHMFQLPAEGISIDEVEMSLVQLAMQRSGDNRAIPAKLLRISRDQLRYQLRKLEGN